MTAAASSETDSVAHGAWWERRSAVCLGITALAVILRAPTLVRRLFDPDEAAIGVQAMVVRAGGTLYTDIFDRKPPLPPLLYAASFSMTDSTDVRLMRVLVLILLAACGVLVAMDLWRRSGPTAAWCGGVLIVTGAMALFPADAGAANYAHFALLPGTAAILWSRRGTLGGALAAGLAIGVAILCRQSWLLGVVPACVSIGLCGRWRNVVPFLAAAAATVATTGLYAPFGRFWQWNVTDSPGFVFAGTNLWSASAKGLASVGGFVAFHPVLVVAAGIAVATALSAARRRQLPTDIDLWLWIGSGLAAWAAGLRFFGHYWLQVVPPLVIVAVPVVARWAGRARQLAIAAVAVPALVAWVLLFVARLVPPPAGPSGAGGVRPHSHHDHRPCLRVGLVPGGAHRCGSHSCRWSGPFRLRRGSLRRPQRPGDHALLRVAGSPLDHADLAGQDPTAAHLGHVDVDSARLQPLPHLADSRAGWSHSRWLPADRRR